MGAEQMAERIGRSDPVIIECGCHDGRDTKSFLDQFPGCSIICFEPDPRPLQRHDPPGFMDRIGDDPRVRLIRAAVGDRDGLTNLWRSSGQPPHKHLQRASDWDDSNSICRPTGHFDYSPWCKFPDDLRLVAPVVRLDTWLETAGPASIDLIWADVQGAEAMLIRGATETLKRTRWLYTEFYDRPMYEGQPNRAEIEQMLPGWELRAIYHGENILLENVG